MGRRKQRIYRMCRKNHGIFQCGGDADYDMEKYEI